MQNLTLVFDLDGTLVDTAPDLVAATNHVLEHMGVAPIDEATLRPVIGHGARYMIERAMGPAGENLSPAQRDGLVERFLDYYGRHIAVGSRPFDGAVAALERFQTQGARLGVCTNKYERMSKRLLDTLDLTRFFSAVAGRDTLSAFKPHPEHLLGTIRMAGGDASRAVMIGDSRVDVATARAAGVPVIAVSFGYTDAPAREFEADAVIDHYDELEPAVAALLASRSCVDGVR